MKKSKVITSAVLSVAMCVGLVFAMTANAADTSSETQANAADTASEIQAAAAPMTISFEDFAKEYPEIHAQSIAAEKARKATLAAQVEEIACRQSTDDDSIEEISAKIEEQLGITVYPASEAVSIDEIEELEDGTVRAIGFPTSYTALPYVVSFGEITQGTYSFTSFYVRPTSSKLSFNYTFRSYGVPSDEDCIARVNLYKQRKSWEGSRDWEAVQTVDISFRSKVATEMRFTDLDYENFVYCFALGNRSENSKAVISGVATISQV